MEEDQYSDDSLFDEKELEDKDFSLDTPLEPVGDHWIKDEEGNLDIKDTHIIYKDYKGITVLSKDEVHIVEPKDNNSNDPIDKIKEAHKENKKNVKKVFVAEMQEHFSIPVMVNHFLEDIPLYYDNNKIWWMWNGQKTIWEMIDETDIMVALSKYATITGIHKSKTITEFLNMFKIEARKRKPQDPPVEWVQFGNQIYDINTNASFPASPQYFFINSLPFTPSDDPNTPFLDKLIGEWAGIENLDLIYQIMAYCCYRDYPLHYLFCFIGSGSNGKSTCLNIITKFIGMENCGSSSLDAIMDNRFETSKFYKKLACMMGETNFGTMKRTELLKKLTGQDLINYEFKNKNGFSDKNYSKILISTNTLPETSDRTPGFYRRWVIIDFNKQFQGDTDILKYIPEYEYNNLSRKVMNILPRLIEERTFSNIGTMEDRRKRFEEKSNPLPVFLKQHTTKEPSSLIPKWEFAKRFNDYLIQNNLRPRSDTEIGIKMKELDYEDSRKTTIINGEEKFVRCWMDLAWAEESKIKKIAEDEFNRFKEERL